MAAKNTDKIIVKVAILIQRYVKIFWFFSLNRPSLLRISHKTLFSKCPSILFDYTRLPFNLKSGQKMARDGFARTFCL